MSGLALRPTDEGAGLLAASGLLLGLAHPPFHLLLPSLLALVPYFLWLGRLPAGAEGRSRALRGGFFLGLLYFSLVLYWLAASLVSYVPLAALAFPAAVLVLSGLLALATLGAHQASRRLGWPVWLAGAVFWTAAEWARAHLGPLSFPWMELGATLTGFPRLIGAADVVGTRGLSFWLAAVSGLLALAWERGRGRAPGGLRLPVAGLLVALALPVGYSLHRWRSLEVEPAATVGVIQPAVPQRLKLRGAEAADSARAAADVLAGRAEMGRKDLDLVVLPETVLPALAGAPSPGTRERRRKFERWAGGLARRTESAVLYGGVGRGSGADGRTVRYNSTFLVDASGDRRARYDKRNLVPVMERAPFAGARWARRLVHSAGFGVGERRGPLTAGGTRFGVLICFESIFAGRSRRYRRAGADFLVNVTNDAWFGRREPWWSRTSALWQHPAHLVMRAVETRTGAVRAANTGISGLIGPKGRWLRRTGLFRPEAFTGRVYTSGGRTLFVEWGDWMGTGSAALAAAAALAVLAARRRER